MGLGTWNLSRYENLLKLHLEHCYKTELPHHDKMPPNLTKLTLIDIGSRKDPMKALKELPKLKILILCYNSYRGKKMVRPGEHGSNFPQLEVLKIVGLETMEELKVGENGMPILKEVSISGCNAVTKVPDRITNILKISTG